MSRKWDGKIPFNPVTGEAQYFPSPVYVREPNARLEPDWRDNVVFEDTLKFIGFSRGRSAANADFETSDGKRVTMFLADLGDAMKQMFAGCLRGSFTYCKRGMNFGIKMVSPVERIAHAQEQRQLHAGARR
jgi:hypothetical protein